MYTWFIFDVSLDINIAKLNRKRLLSLRKGTPYMLVPSNQAIKMGEYFCGQWQGEQLGE